MVSSSNMLLARTVPTACLTTRLGCVLPSSGMRNNNNNNDLSVPQRRHEHRQWETETTTVSDLGRNAKNKGWWGAKGLGRPGYPVTTPHRVPGLDKNLQERLDELYAEENERKRRRRDIGFPAAKVATPDNDRGKRLEWRRRQRSDPDMERAARKGTLEVDLDDVRREHKECGALYRDIREAAELYGVFEDLFPDGIFTPCLDLRVEYDYDEELFTPVHRGDMQNINISFLLPPRVPGSSFCLQALSWFPGSSLQS